MTRRELFTKLGVAGGIAAGAGALLVRTEPISKASTPPRPGKPVGARSPNVRSMSLTIRTQGSVGGPLTRVAYARKFVRIGDSFTNAEEIRFHLNDETWDRRIHVHDSFNGNCHTVIAFADGNFRFGQGGVITLMQGCLQIHPDRETIATSRLMPRMIVDSFRSYYPQPITGARMISLNYE